MVTGQSSQARGRSGDGSSRGDLAIRDVPGGCVLAVKVVPGASRDRIVGVLGDCLKIATSAPPEKGRANQAVAVLLAGALGLRPRDVVLLRGAASPRKEFQVAGLSARDVRDRLGLGDL